MRLALTDPLTGLGNHRHFQEQLQVQLEEAAGARPRRSPSASSTSTTSSRSTTATAIRPATRVLTQVATKLRPLGEAFRLGGDEFALSCCRGMRAEAAAAAAEEAVRALGDEGWEHGGSLNMTAGIATYPDHSDDRNALVRVADIALYWAKGEGKNRVCVYRPDMPGA